MMQYDLLGWPLIDDEPSLVFLASRSWAAG